MQVRTIHHREMAEWEEAMKHAAEIAHFRQLCCLGIDAHTVMPSLLKGLHGLIGSNSNAFYWVSDKGNVTNTYMEQLLPKDLLASFFKDFLNNRDCAFSAHGLRNCLKPDQVVGSSAKLFPKSFHQSDVYNLFWRPESRKEMLWAVVRDASGRENGVTMSRLVGDAEFTDRDERLLAQLVPYFAHALNAPGESVAQLVDAGESAVIVVNRHGDIEHESMEGRRLMLLAAHPRVAPDAVDWRSDQVVPSALRHLLDRVAAIAVGRPTSPPVIELQNCWGKFMLQAYPLNSGGGFVDGAVVIVIERQVPLKLKLLDAMQFLPLSTKQKEVCLLLTDGFSYQDLAQRLGVGRTTIIDHVRKIYDKLDVHNHHELLSKLIQGHHARGIGANGRGVKQSYVGTLAASEIRLQTHH
jgi:DNA-binding CsgD family transcriptional regulator